MRITSKHLRYSRLQIMNMTEKDIVEMIFFPVVNEACRVLDEGIAVKASDLDVASIMGMGFPSYRYLSNIHIDSEILIVASFTFYFSKPLNFNLLPGVVLCSGLTPSGQITYTQDWIHGQRRMAISSSLPPISPSELLKEHPW